jgi:PAS domain S-box-containing protein
MIVPIEQQRVDRCGLALVFFADRRVFDDDDLELARQLARAASGALERSELFENERRTRSLAERLASGRSTLVGAHDPAKLAEQAACQAAELCDADAAVIFMLDHGELVVRGCAGDGLEGFVGRRVSTGVSLAGEVVHSREPLGTARGGVEREMTQRSDPLLESGYAAFLGVPMGGRDETPNGVLAVYSRGERVWRTEEIEALSSLAAYAAAALEGAALYFRISLERERSLAILSSVEDGIVAVDRAGKIVLWNVAAERLTGVEASEALGGTPEDVLQRDLGAGSEALGERTIQIRRGEQEIWLALAEAVMRDPSGQVAGRIYTLRDVSSDRLVEQAKSDFVTSVSHGLRAPLASIYGFAETLLSRDELFDHEQRRTFLGYIVSESRRLTEIVNKLLDAAQLDAGELQVEIERTDVGALVGEVVESVRADSSANSHRFVVELADEPLGAEADSEKLRRVLINLVENAVKYSPADSTITLSARRRAGVVEVRVADEGVGIPVSERERVFRKFYRGGASGLVSGSGLGLFITRGLVNAMGGRIWVDSTESRGSTFTFELPSSSDEEA